MRHSNTEGEFSPKTLVVSGLAFLLTLASWAAAFIVAQQHGWLAGAALLLLFEGRSICSKLVHEYTLQEQERRRSVQTRKGFSGNG